MDNQQEMLNEFEIGWLAGIIDGEGSITLNVRKKHWKGWNGIGVDMKIIIVNTDGGIIDKVISIMNKICIEPHLLEKGTNPIYSETGKTYHNPTKTMLVITISKMAELLKILNLIQPHLSGEKKHRASIIMKFIERRQGRETNRSKGGATWYDKYDWQLVGEFYKLSGGNLLPEVQQYLNDHTHSRLAA